MHPSPGRHLALALAVVLGSAGCSNNDSGSLDTVAPTGVTASASTTSPPTTAPVETTSPVTTSPATLPSTTLSTTAPSTTAPAPVDDEAYVELASTALLDLAVFPDGWEAMPATEDDEAENERFGDRVDECLGNEGERVSDLLDQRKAKSLEFAGPGDSSPSVEQQIIIADDEAMAVTAMQDVGAEGADACLEQTIQEFFDDEAAADVEQDGVTLGDITVERIELDAASDLIVGYLVEIPVEAPDGQTASGYLQVTYQRSGRALSQLQFSSFGTAFDPQLVAMLTNEVVARLATIAE